MPYGRGRGQARDVSGPTLSRCKTARPQPAALSGAIREQLFVREETFDVYPGELHSGRPSKKFERRSKQHIRIWPRLLIRGRESGYRYESRRVRWRPQAKDVSVSLNRKEYDDDVNG